VDDEFMARLKEHFSDEEVVELTIAIGIWDWVHKFNNVFDVIEKILKHLGLDEASQARNRSPPVGLLDPPTQLF
jgi:hypothetical protein